MTSQQVFLLVRRVKQHILSLCCETAHKYHLFLSHNAGQFVYCIMRSLERNHIQLQFWCVDCCMKSDWVLKQPLSVSKYQIVRIELVFPIKIYLKMNNFHSEQTLQVGGQISKRLVINLKAQFIGKSFVKEGS